MDAECGRVSRSGDRDSVNAITSPGDMTADTEKAVLQINHNGHLVGETVHINKNRCKRMEIRECTDVEEMLSCLHLVCPEPVGILRRSGVPAEPPSVVTRLPMRETLPRHFQLLYVHTYSPHPPVGRLIGFSVPI